MSHHTIVVGYGVKGKTAAKTLLTAGAEPNTIVVVSLDEHQLREASHQGLIGVHGDGRREEVLREAMIERASKVVVATNEDDTNVLVTLTARRLAPHSEIVAACRENENAEILRQSGANTVIPTAESAGHLMGMSLLSPTTGRIMEDILNTGDGLDVGERAVTADEIGKSPDQIDASGQLVLAVIRNGQVHRFDHNDITAIEPGDRLVTIYNSSM